MSPLSVTLSSMNDAFNMTITVPHDGSEEMRAILSEVAENLNEFVLAAGEDLGFTPTVWRIISTLDMRAEEEARADW